MSNLTLYWFIFRLAAPVCDPRDVDFTIGLNSNTTFAAFFETVTKNNDMKYYKNGNYKDRAIEGHN